MHLSKRNTGRLALGALVVGGVAALSSWMLRQSPAAASFVRGRQLEADHLIPEARDAYLDAIKINPRYAPPYRALAELASAYDRDDVAVGYWQEYLARDPMGIHARCRLADAELRSGLEQSALNHAEEELHRDPHCPRAHLIAGILYTRKADPKQALDHLSAASNAYPNDPQVQLAYARVLSLTGDYDHAEPILLRILDRDESHAEPFLWLGYIEARHSDRPGSVRKARSYFARALDLQPNFPDAEFEMARLLFRTRSYAEALPFAQKAAAQRPHYPAGLYLKSQILDALGRDTEAQEVRLVFQRESVLAEREKALLKRFNLDRQDAAVAKELGQVEMARDKPEEALLFLRQAAQVAPHDIGIGTALTRAERMLQPPAPAAVAANGGRAALREVAH